MTVKESVAIFAAVFQLDRVVWHTLVPSKSGDLRPYRLRPDPFVYAVPVGVNILCGVNPMGPGLEPFRHVRGYVADSREFARAMC